MIDWVLAGVLSAVLMAELIDAIALHQLVRRCTGLASKSSAERRLVRWYAEGFDHSRIFTGWLRGGCLALTLVCVAAKVHPVLIVASLALAVIAHCERSYSTSSRRRFFRPARRNAPLVRAS